MPDPSASVPSPPASPPTSVSPAALIKRLSVNVARVILDKPEPIELTVLALLTGGHILMEDVPGVGKTVLAKSLARSVQGEFKRVQFTPDLLPADVTGTSVFDLKERVFEFKKGPVFAHVLLADEINRASPRTQSALLEAMSEGQVTVDGTSRPLPHPFLVIATQNPIEFHGTYPLPEAQLDRFCVKLEMGYPAESAEVDILLAQAKRHPFDELAPVATIDEIRATALAIRAVAVARDVAAYMVGLGRALRVHPGVRLGVSPRGALSLFRMSQAHAAARGLDFCRPDDVKAVAVATLAHRIVLEPKLKYSGANPADIVREVLASHPVPA